MDFITSLLKSEEKNAIMVVVDRLTKYANFCALSHQFVANIVAATLMNIIQKLHGIPKIIVRDCDSIFINNFWTHLFSCLSTQRTQSSSYHPQSEG